MDIVLTLRSTIATANNPTSIIVKGNYAYVMCNQSRTMDIFDVSTPTIKAFIHIASIIHNCDYWQMGRNIQKLGIADMTLRELRLLTIGEKKSKE